MLVEKVTFHKPEIIKELTKTDIKELINSVSNDDDDDEDDDDDDSDAENVHAEYGDEDDSQSNEYSISNLLKSTTNETKSYAQSSGNNTNQEDDAEDVFDSLFAVSKSNTQAEDGVGGGEDEEPNSNTEEIGDEHDLAESDTLNGDETSGDNNNKSANQNYIENSEFDFE